MSKIPRAIVEAAARAIAKVYGDEMEIAEIQAAAAALTATPLAEAMEALEMAVGLLETYGAETPAFRALLARYHGEREDRG